MGPFTEVVIGATDAAATVAFLSLFDFERVDSVSIPAAEAAGVFGLPATAIDAVRLASPATPTAATLLVVPTPNAGVATVGWELGPRALDVYTTDLDATVAVATGAGFDVSPIGGLSAGPMTMRQAMVHGPGGLSVVFVESTHRRASVLDAGSGGLHSEPHSVVWVVGDHTAEVTWWSTGGWTTEGRWDVGFTAGNTISFSEPTISDELGLADRPTPITMTMLSDPAVAPIRLELMTFDDHRPDDGPTPDPVLRSGLFALTVGDAGGESTRLVTSPGGVRVVLRP